MDSDGDGRNDREGDDTDQRWNWGHAGGMYLDCESLDKIKRNKYVTMDSGNRTLIVNH